MKRSIGRFAIAVAALGLALAASCSEQEPPKRPSRKPRRPLTRLVTRSAPSAVARVASLPAKDPASAGTTTRRAAATAAAPATRQAMRRVHLFISGRVQGVGFRASTRYAALELKVTGWVKNLPDKRVEAVVEGPADKVAALIEYVRKGPPRANVTDVQVAEEKHQGEFDTFEVRF